MPQLKPFQDELSIPDVIRPLSGVLATHYLAIAARPEKRGAEEAKRPAVSGLRQCYESWLGS